MNLPGVLGLDMLSQVQGVLDLRRGEMKIGDLTIILSEKEEDLEVRLKTAEIQTIPPWSEGVIELEAASGAQSAPLTLGLVEGMVGEGDQGYQISRALVEPEHGIKKVTLLNPSPYPLSLPQRTEVATTQEVREVGPPQTLLGENEMALLPDEPMTQCSTAWWRKNGQLRPVDTERLLRITGTEIGAMAEDGGMIQPNWEVVIRRAPLMKRCPHTFCL